MLNHHIKENNLIKHCLYCHNPLKSWKSEHLHNFHYKISICNNCGKEHRIKVDFESSGHDNWNRKEYTTKEELEEINNEFNRLIDKFHINSNRR